MKVQLDLHGYTHEDARRKIIHFVEDNWNNTEDDLKIITGHSTKMKQIVMDVLSEYDLCYTKGGVDNPLVTEYILWFLSRSKNSNKRYMW